MTPDLKELRERLINLSRYIDPCAPAYARACCDAVIADAVNALPALIAKAERVDALEAVTEQAREAIDQALDDMRDYFSVCPATKDELILALSALSPRSPTHEY